MRWWMKNNLRMIQNNLRDIDGRMDVDYEVQKLKKFGANTVQIGCGGISSFLPDCLDVQKQTPYLNPKMFGELVEKCHENNIKVIARFDFSKTHESFMEEHSDWFMRVADGSAVKYNNTYATCINGAYQKKHSLEIIRDAITRFPVDGIFFNMFGYITRDYSGKYIGICQCENCRSEFRKRYGMELPLEEDETDPAYQLYKQFKRDTADEILDSIRTMVKGINPDIAISTYHCHGVDIVRNESNSAVDRPLPFWLYSSSENVASLEGSYSDKISSNCAINAVDLPYRFMGVSKYLTAIRLYENMANNSGLDWCIIGSFEDYPDRDNFELVKEIFHFHKKNEAYYGNLKSTAKIILVQPYDSGEWITNPEFRGIFKMLKEAHRMFRVVNQYQLSEILPCLNQYDTIILPGVQALQKDEIWKEIEKTKIRVIITGLGLKDKPELLRNKFGISLKEQIHEIRGSYMLTEPKTVFKDFELRDWVYLDQDYWIMETEEETERLLPFISSAMYGPPERCFGHQVTDIPSVSVKKKKYIYFPWMIGTLYYQQGYEDMKKIFLNVMDAYTPNSEPFDTDAPEMVELFWDMLDEKRYMLQLINLTGFNGTTMMAPLKLNDIHIGFKGSRPVKVTELTSEGEIQAEALSEMSISNLGIYKAYIIEF